MIRRSLILSTTIDLLVRTGIVFSLFLLFAGHNAPGGGFVAGLVAGVILTLRYLTSGVAGVRTLLPSSPPTVMGVGLAISLLTGVAGWLWGNAFLESVFAEISVPVLGTLKASTAVLFDVGVFAVVVGMVGASLMSLGAQSETSS